MKRYILILAVLIFVITSCDTKDDFENEKSATVGMAGEWYVQYDHADYGADPFGVGLTQLLTFNTSSNASDVIWITDVEHFWDFKVKIPVDLTTSTFGSLDTIVNSVSSNPIKVIIEKGKITKNAKLLPSGTMADSIYFEVWFDNLEDETGIESDRMLVSGFRKSGFVEDEP